MIFPNSPKKTELSDLNRDYYNFKNSGLVFDVIKSLSIRFGGVLKGEVSNIVFLNKYVIMEYDKMMKI